MDGAEDILDLCSLPSPGNLTKEVSKKIGEKTFMR